MNNQEQIFNLIYEERNRQLGGLELIASENFTSENVMKATGSILTNKYAEGYPGKRYYGGCEIVDKIENLAIDRLKKLFNLIQDLKLTQLYLMLFLNQVIRFLA